MNKITKRVINLKIRKKDFFKQYIHICRTVLEKSLTKTNGVETRLIDSEIDLLALILYYNDIYKVISQEERLAYILSTVSKKKMIKELGVSSSRFDVMVFELKKKGIVNKEKGLDSRFEIYLNESADNNIQELLFKFTVV